MVMMASRMEELEAGASILTMEKEEEESESSASTKEKEEEAAVQYLESKN